MEQVHGVDVSWMTHDKAARNSLPTKTPSAALPRQIPGANSRPKSPASAPTDNASVDSNISTNDQSTTPNGSSATKRISRSNSIDKQTPPGTSPHRRNSWFSNISAKFSSSNTPPAGPPSPAPIPESSPAPPSDPVPPKLPHTKNAVLPHAAKPEGDGPYIPAPPRSGQPGFLGMFRRLSSSNNGALSQSGKLGHGLVDRVVLNVDQSRERCPISELSCAKLRRVAFCVDVEIAPQPKYADYDSSLPKTTDKTQKKKLTEKGEGEALKNPKAVEEQKETNGEVKTTGETLPKEPEKEGTEAPQQVSEVINGSPTPVPEKKEENTKKKEKKKKSEEERKARKEKKRKLAEANGSIPMEIHYGSSDDSAKTKTPPNSPETNKPQTAPTTNPVRVYRRCCQLRETPILKKITEQLTDTANYNASTGTVNKLDLTDYWLQLPDLITLGDYLAIVPVREILLENSGLGDEGLRVILAGLLAAKRPAVRRRKPKHDDEDQGGVVERLVLKNNKIGPDGWKYLSLFIYLCRSLKFLDVSYIQFPRQPQSQQNGSLNNGVHIPRSISSIFSAALGERLGGSTLELVNIGQTGLTMGQLGTIVNGLIQCGVKRLGLSHNQIDAEGMKHVVKFLAEGHCEGLDLGGNDLSQHTEALATAIENDTTLWGLGMADCNLTPSALCKILPVMVKLPNLRFFDLSQNPSLFQSTPSAVGLLRRYLPKMKVLKRMHLEDAAMTPEQAIAIVEVLPEVKTLAHINITNNAEIVKLADASTEEAQEEACALYASLLAAARVSKSLICVDIEVPSEHAGEIVKAMAKQVVAYCLRNMERLPDTDAGAVLASTLAENNLEAGENKLPPYPDVLAHLVGHDILDQDESDDDNGSAPDEDYVIGGTGVVKALACCLKNRGDESRRQSGEFIREIENGASSPAANLSTGGKAKDMSKHLLMGARKIRQRLQPALIKARANPDDDHNLRRLTFLDDTLQGIIKRFEDEYPDTREDPALQGRPRAGTKGSEESPTTLPLEDSALALSDNEDEGEITGGKPLSRSNSMAKILVEEEGRILRAGHRFRAGLIKEEQIDLLSTIDDIGSDPKHVRMLVELAEDLGGEIWELVKEKGPVRAFKEDRDIAFKCMEASDPEHWARFAEAQYKSRANISIPSAAKQGEVVDESAVAD
ncbi:GIP3 Glc7-interacting whose overexpression relocalizes Glc7p from the nucleus [Fusarium agapanthi]|uniref:GIP3 Glc7-interacting whose overexpression relocalizes Glc7p from the nucleus n=1 Tax=Fusarium agapanthi TaxID=1803897 RepID=A0A9P5AZ88_9HYPO|nr:GIP3 Glc7-interacting whose overexpression relocalizes Glc7p from the nucleus [Fusarium agapanthi]